MTQTAKLNSVPGCPRVEVLSLDYAGKAVVKSDEAEPGREILAVPSSELSSFEGERRDPKRFEVGDLVVDIDGTRIGRVADAQPAELMDYVCVNWAPLDAPGIARVHVTTIDRASADDLADFAAVV